MAGRPNFRAECDRAVREGRLSDLPGLLAQMPPQDPFRFYYASYTLPLPDAIDNLFEAIVRRPNWRTPFHRLAEIADYEPHERVELKRGIVPDHLLPAKFVKPLAPLDADLQWRSLPEEGPIRLPEPLGRFNQRFRFAKADQIRPVALRSTLIRDGFVYWDAQWFQAFEQGRAKNMGPVSKNQTLLRASAPHLVHDAYFNLHFDETVHLVGSAGAGSFYHWFIDILPLLAAAQAQYPEHKVRKICTNGSSLPFQLESLKMLAPEAEIIEFNGPRIIHAPQILYTAHDNAMGERVPQWSIDFLRGLRTQDPVPDIPRLYVARREGSGRALQPSAQVEEMMRERGFKVIYLEDYDLQHQFALFAGADVVVSAHGAGLTHTLHMRAGSVLVEVFGDHMVSSFRCIAGRQGVHYIPVSMPSDFDRVDHRTAQQRNQTRFADINVEFDRLAKAIDLALMALN